MGEPFLWVHATLGKNAWAGSRNFLTREVVRGAGASRCKFRLFCRRTEIGERPICPRRFRMLEEAVIQALRRGTRETLESLQAGGPLLIFSPHHNSGRPISRVLCEKWAEMLRALEWSDSTQPTKCTDRPDDPWFPGEWHSSAASAHAGVRLLCSCPLLTLQHHFSQDPVDSRLVARAFGLEPIHNLYIHAQRDSPFARTVPARLRARLLFRQRQQLLFNRGPQPAQFPRP